MKNHLVFLLALFSFFLGSCGSSVPPELRSALRGATDVELISLEPDELTRDPKKPGTFHGWKVLGRTKLSTADDRETLAAAFERAIEESDGSVASCFNPRHGIVLQFAGKTHEFVICFECSSFEWHIDGARMEGKPIESSPRADFDALLTKAGVPLAKKTVAP